MMTAVSLKHIRARYSVPPARQFRIGENAPNVIGLAEAVESATDTEQSIPAGDIGPGQVFRILIGSSQTAECDPTHGSGQLGSPQWRDNVPRMHSRGQV